MHLSSFHVCLLLQILASSVHLHLRVLCHFICLVSLVLENRLNTFTFMFLIWSGTHILAYGLLIVLQLPLHLFKIGYILEVDVEYPKDLHGLHSDLPFLSERMKTSKCSKLVCNLYDKKNYVVHIRALNHGLILKNVHKIIQFNQEAWLNEYIDMNTELRKQAKNDFEKDFFKLMNNSVFGKTMENVRKHRVIKLVTTDKRTNYLVPEPNYHSTKWFSQCLLATEMKKIKVKMKKPIYLGLSILEISKALMYQFWYNYINLKY